MFEVTDTVDEMLKGLGARLCEQRLASRLTQDELAKRAGISKRSLERLEKAEADPRLSAFIAVCQVLGLSQGFNTLVPEVELGPLAVAEGKRLPKRVRKSAKQKTIQWGDEK